MVPDALRDKELCLEAVRIRPDRIDHVPSRVLDTEIYQAYLEAWGTIDEGLIPADAWTKQMCIVALQMNRCTLMNVPERLRNDRDACEVAVKMNASNLNHVPGDLRDLEMYLAGRNHGRALLAFVPVHLRAQVEAKLR